MPKLFFPAPEVAEVAHELIERNYHHLTEHDVRVEFVFCSETPYKNGKARWGEARKISSLSSFLKRADETNWAPGLTDEQIETIEDEDDRDSARVDAMFARKDAQEKGNAPFFAITISKPIWEMLNEAHRAALVDHELMHCGATYDNNGKTKLYLIPHDFEGFNAEIERHGIWRYDAAQLAETMKGAQLTLTFNGESAAPETEEDSLDEAVARISELADVSVTFSPLLPVNSDEAPPKKKRGRPRKNPDSVAVATA